MKKTMKQYLLSAQQGDADAQCRMGDYYMDRHATMRNVAAAAEWYRKAAEQGNLYARYRLSKENLFWGNVSVREADKWKRLADEQCCAMAEQGDVYARFLVSLYDLNEIGENLDDEVRKWGRKAAEQGNAHAQFELGLMLESGDGRFIDNGEAEKWLRKAAEQGFPYARYELRRQIAYRRKTHRLVKKAISKYLRTGSKEAEDFLYHLGECFIDKCRVRPGLLVSTDLGHAAECFTVLAQHGNAAAQAALKICSHPHGEELDKAMAKERHLKMLQAAIQEELISLREEPYGLEGDPDDPDAAQDNDGSLRHE